MKNKKIPHRQNHKYSRTGPCLVPLLPHYYKKKYVFFNNTVHGYIYIVKNIVHSNKVGGALRGTRQGPVLEYLWSEQFKNPIEKSYKGANSIP